MQLSEGPNHLLVAIIDEALEQAVTDFCAGCPDPVQAYRVLFETVEELSDEDVLNRVLRAPVRAMNEVPTSIVPANHPARSQH